MFKIYVDADACPTVIKEILYRVSQRTGIEVTSSRQPTAMQPRVSQPSRAFGLDQVLMLPMIISLN